MQLVDTHTHLDDPRFDADREAVITRARKCGISHFVVPAVTSESWERIDSLCHHYPELRPAYGLHPMFMADHRMEDVTALAGWLEQKPAVAVGECGLDFYIPEPDREAQQTLFEAQLELADRFSLPVIIHARRSVEEVLHTLRRFPGVEGVLHSFSGSRQQAERLIDLGFRFGFGGPVTHGNAHRLQALVKWMPLDVMLLETDSPDQPDATHARQRNEPGYLPLIVQAICRLKGITPTLLAERTSANARRLFALEPT
ncbi:MAG: TatD family hydrolase [Sedimenticola sp.]|nr:TatD family hydrolase [Sedimenticola sp.]